MSDLNVAIQLIRQGHAAKAQKYLEIIVRTEPQNVPAWLWYAQTWPTDEARLKVLVACLKFNPGDEKVLQAIKLIRGKAAAQPKPPIAPPSPAFSQNSSAQPAEQGIEIPSIFMQIQAEQEQVVEEKPAFNWDELEKNPTPSAPAFEAEAQPSGPKSAFNWDELEQNSAPSSPAFTTRAQPAESKSAFNWDEIDPEPASSQPALAQSTGSATAFNWNEIEQEASPSMPLSAVNVSFTKQSESTPPEAKTPGRSFKFYEVWWIALTKQNVRAYAELLDDPQAGTGRVVEWVAYVSLMSGALALGLQIYLYGILKNSPEFEKTFAVMLSTTSETTLLIWAVIGALLTPIFAILSLLFISWLQYFIAISIGGKGNFKRTLYAIGSFVTPLQALGLLISIPFFIYFGSILSNFKVASPPSTVLPTLLSCLTPFFLIYMLIVNIRALQAALQLSIGKALGAIIGAFIVQSILSCCLNFVVSSVLGNILQSFLPGINPKTPTY